MSEQSEYERGRESCMEAMSSLYSLLSLVRHRHLPRGLADLEKDIDQALLAGDKLLQPWWKSKLLRGDPHPFRSH